MLPLCVKFFGQVTQLRQHGNLSSREVVRWWSPWLPPTGTTAWMRLWSGRLLNPSKSLSPRVPFVTLATFWVWTSWVVHKAGWAQGSKRAGDDHFPLAKLLVFFELVGGTRTRSRGHPFVLFQQGAKELPGVLRGHDSFWVWAVLVPNRKSGFDFGPSSRSSARCA